MEREFTKEQIQKILLEGAIKNGFIKVIPSDSCRMNDKYQFIKQNKEKDNE